jgi:hypothetical protein
MERDQQTIFRQSYQAFRADFAEHSFFLSADSKNLISITVKRPQFDTFCGKESFPSIKIIGVMSKKAVIRRCRSYRHFAKLRHTKGFTNVNAFVQLSPTSSLLFFNKPNCFKSYLGT